MIRLKKNGTLIPLFRWLYLEPVFNRGALLQDAGRFRRLDADFRYIMSEISRDTRITTILRIPNFRSVVTNLLDQVGRCQKSLYEFLEVRKETFLTNFQRYSKIVVKFF